MAMRSLSARKDRAANRKALQSADGGRLDFSHLEMGHMSNGLYTYINLTITYMYNYNTVICNINTLLFGTR